MQLSLGAGVPHGHHVVNRADVGGGSVGSLGGQHPRQSEHARKGTTPRIPAAPEASGIIITADFIAKLCLSLKPFAIRGPAVWLMRSMLSCADRVGTSKAKLQCTFAAVTSMLLWRLAF